MKWYLTACLFLLYSCQSANTEMKTASIDTLNTMQQDTAFVKEQISVSSDPALVEENGYLSYTADAKDIGMYWKHNGAIIQTFQELKRIEPQLKFAMNGGMYTSSYAPVGLYVEKGKLLKPIKIYNNPKVNFGLQPQGVFLIRDHKAEVIPVENYQPKGVTYATQSAPMLVLNSKINPKLPHSDSRHIRNGVGILPDGKVLLVLSRNLVTFQEFAQYFVDKGCSSALYLDGGISDVYVPMYDTYGYFGVLIGVVK